MDTWKIRHHQRRGNVAAHEGDRTSSNPEAKTELPFHLELDTEISRAAKLTFPSDFFFKFSPTKFLRE